MTLKDDQETKIIVYALGGTWLCLAVAAVLAVYLKRRQKLNWFEKNVLEISKGDPEVIRYGRSDTMNLVDEDEGWVAYDHSKKKAQFAENRGVKWENVSDDSGGAPPPRPRRMSVHRRQSRIVFLSPSDLDALTTSAGTMSSPFTDKPKDASSKFYVPKMRDISFSMFRTLDMSKLDRGMYDTRQNSVLKEEQVVGLCGSLNMALNFDPCTNLLTVKLIQAANLVARRTDDTPPNPYFKVHLIPGEFGSEPQLFESKRYQGVRSVLLGEEFMFNVPNGNVRGCQLEVTVYDAEENVPEDECIGCCWLALSRVDITEDPVSKTAFWAEILPLDAGDEESGGEILFSTSYSAKNQRLTVNIIKARNLVNPGNSTEPPDPCVKVTIHAKGKKLKQRRTATKKANYHPSFNETLTFNIPKNSLCDVVLSINVCHDAGAFHHSKVLGQVEIPLHKCKDLWRALIRGEDSKATWYDLEK